MSDILIIEGEATDDGELILQLPPDRPRGRLRITIESAPENPELSDADYDAELEELLNDDNPYGLGLTADEIAKSPEIGAWAHRTDITDSVEFIAEQRRKRRERRMNRD